MDGSTFGLGTALAGIDWVIVGGESGPNARPMYPDWVRSIRDQCVEAGTAFWFKQWGEWREVHPLDDFSLWSISETINLDPDTTIARVGKKIAGCLLDGKEWKQFPKVAK